MTIVALGGGTGLPAVLRALRRHLPASHRITAIVTAADDGGSSGVLRRQYGVLPPGDIRNCLLALARVPPEVSAEIQQKVDMAKLESTLMREGLEKFADPQKALIKLISEKRAALR